MTPHTEAEHGNPPGSGYFSGVGEGNVVWHPGEYPPDPDAVVGLPLEALPAPGDIPPGPCRCGQCGSTPEPVGGFALLAYGPGVTERTWRNRVRTGQWDDIQGLFDDAYATVHKPALRGQRQIHLDLVNGVGHIAAVFETHPDWRDDPELAEGLHRAEADVAEQGDALLRWVADRAAELRREAGRRCAA